MEYAEKDLARSHVRKNNTRRNWCWWIRFQGKHIPLGNLKLNWIDLFAPSGYFQGEIQMKNFCWWALLGQQLPYRCSGSDYWGPDYIEPPRRSYPVAWIICFSKEEHVYAAHTEAKLVKDIEQSSMRRDWIIFTSRVSNLTGKQPEYHSVFC